MDIVGEEEEEEEEEEEKALFHSVFFPFHPNSFSAFFKLEKAVGLGRRWSPSRAHMHGSTAGEDKSPGADSWSFLLV